MDLDREISLIRRRLAALEAGGAATTEAKSEDTAAVQSLPVGAEELLKRVERVLPTMEALHDGKPRPVAAAPEPEKTAS